MERLTKSDMALIDEELPLPIDVRLRIGEEIRALRKENEELKDDRDILNRAIGKLNTQQAMMPARVVDVETVQAFIAFMPISRQGDANKALDLHTIDTRPEERGKK